MITGCRNKKKYVCCVCFRRGSEVYFSSYLACHKPQNATDHSIKVRITFSSDKYCTRQMSVPAEGGWDDEVRGKNVTLWPIVGNVAVIKQGCFPD